MAPPTTSSVLLSLPKARLLELARTFSVALAPSATREAQADALAKSGAVRFRKLLGCLGRDEIKATCRVYGLDDGGRARPALAARLLQARPTGTEVTDVDSATTAGMAAGVLLTTTSVHVLAAANFDYGDGLHAT